MLTNADIKRISELKERSGREEQAKFLIEGKRAVTEALTNNTSIERIIVNIAVDPSKFAEIFSVAEEIGIALDEVPAGKFSRLSSTGTSQGIIAIANIPSISLDDILNEVRSKRNALVIILERISDPGNFGTILRSASWFGVDAILTGEGSVDVYNPKVVRSALAAISCLKVVQEIKPSDEISKFKSIGFKIIASSQNGKTNYADYTFPQKSCLIFGSEAAGIERKTLDLCDESVMIPRVGKMESLNVGVASAIIMSEMVRQKSVLKK
ncbi:MAG TPA: RNA methyltransferase [Candidatus Acidoferrales bacterium]|nr:RNA methyltransferase [Candidatus Acidoferrales bacterium]